MKSSNLVIVITTMSTLFMPQLLMAQGMAEDLSGLQSVLESVYKEMLPLSEKLIGTARGLAGFAALWYIAVRVWRQIAQAEVIDFYPLMRPFALGLAILFFPSVLAVLNGVLSPVTSATRAMVKDSDKAIKVLLKKKEEALKASKNWQLYVGESGEGDREKWYKYTHPQSDEGMLESIGNDMQFAMEKAGYNLRNTIKQWMSEVLQVLFEAAALCINTIRTFYLVVLAILGPLVFGLSVFDGFQHTLSVWIARYINVYLWLPVANIFGSVIAKVQENMLKLDLIQIVDSGDTFFSATDTAYLIFLLMGILGYFTVPSVANAIVHAGGGNGLLQKVNSLVIGSSKGAMAAMAGAAGGGAVVAGMLADAHGDSYGRMTGSMQESGSTAGYFKEPLKSENDSYKKDKLSANT